MSDPQPVLLKLRPSDRLGLRSEQTRCNLRPLYGDTAPGEPFAVGAASAWFVADMAIDQPTAWDHAHAQIADQLGIDESDVIYAEPDLVHEVFLDRSEPPPGGFAAAENCVRDEQDAEHDKAVGPDTFAWHLGDDFSQLGSARAAVPFSEPRTRIAHIDTGYSRSHVSKPAHIVEALERNFVRRDGNPTSAEEPIDNRRAFPIDNSGHGTGTLSILAGSFAPDGGPVMGAAPEAEVVPIRVANTVVHLRTSVLARAFRYVIEAECDVVTLSMGGLPTRAWAEAVDEAYEAGVCICAAAGNHVGFTPPRTMVFPARYPRVIGVAGIMADGRPYADLDGVIIEGSFGPRSAMEAGAMAAYTPNIPWAKFGCDDIIDLDGQGTSSATPQVAAAAALWLEQFKTLPRDWRRVEAVRHALFSSADKSADDVLHFGQGILRAQSALAVRPDLGRPKSPRSKNSFAFLRLISGLGFDGPVPRERMFNLEIAQRWMLSETLQGLVEDPDVQGELDPRQLRRFMEALIEDPACSMALRRHIASRYPVAANRPVPRTEAAQDVVPEDFPAFDDVPEVPSPPYRRIRIYAVDPSLSGQVATADLNEAVLKIRWEEVDKGPIGEYLAIYDFDDTGKRHAGVDLDDPKLLAQDGWAPSEGNPQFHQQMVYAVAMKTIEHFENALGRPVLWRPKHNPDNPFDDRDPILQLKVKPHALHQANAFYSPKAVALLFGYYEASSAAPGRHVPGSRIYSCLSHDIIAHETTHAVLDGMYRRFNEPTNPDVLALHEGFADIVALFQHFTMPEIVEREIANTRGDLESESMLGSLAIQFGDAMAGRGALRNAIGELKDGTWHRLEPDPLEIQRRKSPHARGAILVAAVFDAFLTIYKTRTADLLRLATGGTGVLPDGAIHPDLVRRLASEASKAAAHVLRICIRALDYLPPVDVTFFEYLRALITADFEMVRDDRLNYRVAFVEAFRRRGIYPQNLGEASPDTPRTLAVDTLRWHGLDLSVFDDETRQVILEKYDTIIDGLKRYADDCLYLGSREELFHKTREHRLNLHRKLEDAFAEAPEFARELGLDPDRKGFEVHELRRALYVAPDGRQVPTVVVALTQSRPVERQGLPRYFFRGGSTLVVDLTVPAVRYRIYKSMTGSSRQERTEAFLREAHSDPLRALFLSHDHEEPFGVLHALAEDGVV
ncbi:MAG: S8 family serine peptidase [Thermoanaerobaculia bacterium]|nr:S8 family serine peptidase [Thermoanaerobaculia bacterium]